MQSAWIVERAKALGFDLCGVVRAEQFPDLEQYKDWLERGYAGEMAYLEDPRRREPARVIADLRSVIVCALNYNTAHPYSTEVAAAHVSDSESPRGWVSRYAWGHDYHQVLWDKLNALVAVMKETSAEAFAARAYADTGPVAERVFAKYAGLGWLGKNTLLLHEALGSWLFLGVIFTSLELTPTLGLADAPPPDLCGNCRQCLDACPTGALVEPYVLDARRCISYLTIELRGPLPDEFREALGWQVYGCDICQDVCPFNRAAPVCSVNEFEPRRFSSAAFFQGLKPTSRTAKTSERKLRSSEEFARGETTQEESLFLPRLEWLAGLTEEDFRKVFRGSAMKRAKWAGLMRNACVALGNSRIREGTVEGARMVKLLERLEESENSTVAESARWALSRIQSAG
jgi:epoxyqueuosine reductase